MIQELVSDPFKHIREQASHMLAKTERLKNDLEETKKAVNSKIPTYLNRGENLYMAEVRQQRQTSEAQKMKEICSKHDDLQLKVRNLKKQLDGRTGTKQETVTYREKLQIFHCEYQKLFHLACEVRAELVRRESLPQYEGRPCKNCPVNMHIN